MTIKNTAFMLSAALALAVGASSHEANAAAACNIDAPTSLAGSSCGTADDRSTGVVRIINDGKRATYKVKITAGTFGVSGSLLDSSGARSKQTNGSSCLAAGDVAPVNANFGPEQGCTLLVLFSPTKFRLITD